MCWFGRMQHIHIKSHYTRCLALELLCNSLCGLSHKIWRALVCRMNRLFFADELVLHAWSSQQGLQLAFDRFPAACDQAGTKISSKKIEVLCVLRCPRLCFLQVSGNTLQQVETFKYLGVVFTSDESRKKEIDTRIGKANVVLRELYCSVVAKRELSKNGKLSVFKIGPCSDPHLWSWILGNDWKNTVKRIKAEMGYLRRVLGVTLRNKEHRSEIREARDVNPLLRMERSHLC